MWRVPVWGDFGPAGEVVYRPMFGGQFGGSQPVPMRRLMKAFCLAGPAWSDRRDVPDAGVRRAADQGRTVAGLWIR